MVIIDCPNCGPRNVQEFRYGGELNPRPKTPMEVPDDDWNGYVFMRANKMGDQQEWWYHRAGCGSWFLAVRHTKSNEVKRTFKWKTAADVEAESD